MEGKYIKSGKSWVFKRRDREHSGSARELRVCLKAETATQLTACLVSRVLSRRTQTIIQWAPGALSPGDKATWA